MTKQEFLQQLSAKLEGVPEEEKLKSIDFYSEMMDDRMEDGMSEEEAVEAVGTVDDAVKEILSSIPLSDLIRSRKDSRGKLKTWQIVLLAVGSPVWVPLLIAFFAVLLALYVALWAVVVSFFAADIALFVSGIASVIVGIAAIFRLGSTWALAAVGGGLILTGGSVMLIVPLSKLAKATAKLAKVIVLWIKSWFVGRKKDA